MEYQNFMKFRDDCGILKWKIKILIKFWNDCDILNYKFKFSNDYGILKKTVSLNGRVKRTENQNWNFLKIFK